MRILLDTPVVLWAAMEPARLSSSCRGQIEDGSNQVFVSAVTAWEIAIKQSLGKLDLERPAELWLPDVLRRTGFESLPVEQPAALRVRSLPWHHRDPFDRLLAAQSLEGGFTFATVDAVFDGYGLQILRA